MTRNRSARTGSRAMAANSSARSAVWMRITGSPAPSEMTSSSAPSTATRSVLTCCPRARDSGGAATAAPATPHPPAPPRRPPAPPAPTAHRSPGSARSQLPSRSRPPCTPNAGAFPPTDGSRPWRSPRAGRRRWAAPSATPSRYPTSRPGSPVRNATRADCSQPRWASDLAPTSTHNLSVPPPTTERSGGDGCTPDQSSRCLLDETSRQRRRHAYLVSHRVLTFDGAPHRSAENADRIQSPGCSWHDHRDPAPLGEIAGKALRGVEAIRGPEHVAHGRQVSSSQSLDAPHQVTALGVDLDRQEGAALGLSTNQVKDPLAHAWPVGETVRDGGDGGFLVDQGMLEESSVLSETFGEGVPGSGHVARHGSVRRGRH